MLAKYLESLQWKSLWSCKTLFLVCRYLGWVFPCKNKNNYKLSFPLKFWDGILHLQKLPRYLSFPLRKAEKTASKFYLDFPSWTNFGPSTSTEDTDGLKDKSPKSPYEFFIKPQIYSHSRLSMRKSFPFHSVPSSLSNTTASFSLEASVLPSLPTQLWTALFWWKESLIICVTTVF